MVKFSVIGLLFSSLGIVRCAKTYLGLTELVLNQMYDKGYTKNEIHSLVGAIRSSFLNFSEEKGECGEGLKGLLDRQIIPGDPDSLERVSGIIHNGQFQLFRGKLPIVNLTSSSILLPLESLSDTCFGIRSNTGIGHNICTQNRNMRNTWMNAISELVLCNKTGIRTGKLPSISKQQNVLSGSNIGSPKPRGIDIIIKDSDLGKPFLTINGKPVSQIIQKQALAAQKAMAPQVNVESEEDDIEIPAEVDGSSSLDVSGGSVLTDAEKIAIQESDAEHLMIPLHEAPPTGYAVLHMSNKKRK